jgi:DeoR family transcriptional regulator, aga operon transcriptional repressor
LVTGEVPTAVHTHMSLEQPSRLLTEERRREIVGILERQGRVTVSELRRHFGISAVTARSDLDALHASGILVRSHGGGIRPIVKGPDYPLKVRENIHHEEKLRIARAAAALIKPHQTVIIGSGTTCGELANQLRQSSPEHLTVITYALNIAMRLADVPKLSLVMIGGIFRETSTALVGPQAEQMIGTLHADHCFLTTVGIDASVGLTTLDILEAQLNAKMMIAAREVTVMADFSKFGHRSLAVIGGPERFHRVITDDKAPADALDALRAKGVRVTIAEAVQ